MVGKTKKLLMKASGATVDYMGPGGQWRAWAATPARGSGRKRRNLPWRRGGERVLLPRRVVAGMGFCPVSMLRERKGLGERNKNVGELGSDGRQRR